jgi:hypothetical protein
MIQCKVEVAMLWTFMTELRALGQPLASVELASILLPLHFPFKGLPSLRVVKVSWCSPSSRCCYSHNCQVTAGMTTMLLTCMTQTNALGLLLGSALADMVLLRRHCHRKGSCFLQEA